MESIGLIIDGRALQADKGKSLLEVSLEGGIYIPTFVITPISLPSASAGSAWSR